MKTFNLPLKVVLLLAVSAIAATGDLDTPAMTNEEPAAGKRVRQVAPEYKGTDVYHSLYLPIDWKPSGKYPVIVEYTGNQFPPGKGSGEVKDANLGYGMSGGKGFIWVCMPYVEKGGKKNAVKWWGDKQATVEYCKVNLPRICKDFGGDRNNVFICGFSRGAIGSSYIGLADDEIASFWKGMFTHDHFDGQLEKWGYPECDRKSALKRLARLKGRPVLVCGQSIDNLRSDFLNHHLDLAQFTFLNVPTNEIFNIPEGKVFHAHTDMWMHRESKYRQQARAWLQKVVKSRRISDESSPEFSKAKVPFSAIASNLEYKGIAVQEDEYTVWGAAPVVDDNGKVHLYVARWPEDNVNPAWRKSSEIAHYVADHPEGPFKFVSVVLKGSGVKDAWDCYAPHNPDIQRIDGKYVLTYIANSDYRQPPHPLNQQIGMMTADSPYGPWKKAGDNGLVLDDSKDPNHFSHGRQVCNPTLAKFKGRYFLYYKTVMKTPKETRSVFAAATADKLEGPYRHPDTPFSAGDFYIEDASAFIWDDKLCLLTTDNHGKATGIRGGGVLWISEDGKTCDPALVQVGFDQFWRYYPDYDPEKATRIYGRQQKIERPKVLMRNGKPAYLYGAAGWEITGRPRTVNYVLKINLPDDAGPLPETAPSEGVSPVF